MARVLVLNGPNLNLLGTRKPEVYGHTTLPEVEQRCRELGESLGVEVECRQSNHEGELVDWVQQEGPRCRTGESYGIVLNPGAYAHTSVALRDAIEGASAPVVEVHISNVHAREDFRHHSYLTPVCRGVIAGLGVTGYGLGLRALVEAGHAAYRQV